jgi:transposase-like protein
MAVRIAGERMYLWRAVDHEGEVLDMLVQGRRNCRAALRLMRKLLKKQGFAPRLWRWIRSSRNMTTSAMSSAVDAICNGTIVRTASRNLSAAS